MEKMKYMIVAFLLFALTNCKEKSVDNNAPSDDQYIRLSPEFERVLIEANIDPDKVADEQVRYADIKAVDSLNITLHGNNLSLLGLEYFKNLKYLKLATFQPGTNEQNGYYYAFANGVNKTYVPPLDTLDVSRNENLQYLDCSGRSDGGGYKSSIKFLKLGNNNQLREIVAQFTMLDSVDLAQAPSLEHLDISGCYSLATLRICNNPKLTTLRSPQVRLLYVPSLKGVKATWETGGSALLECSKSK